MEDHRLLGMFGVGTLFQGLNGVVAKWEPVLQEVFVLAQIVVAILTAILIYKKIRKK